MPNQGLTPPDYMSAVGQVRVLLGDDDSIPLVPPVVNQGEYMWFGDEAISAVVTLYAGNVFRAAARLLMTVAGSQALLLKKWSADDLSVDGAAIAEALRKQAADLMAEAETAAGNVDSFIVAYPGRTKTYVPEGFPIPIPLIGREAYWPGGQGDGPDWIIDGDGYIIDNG